MAVHQIPLRMKIHGKLPGGRVEREFLVSENVSVSVTEVSQKDLRDAITVKLDYYIYNIEEYNRKFYIRDSVGSDLVAAQLRAQSFLVSDYHVAKKFVRGSTFDVLRHQDGKLLQQKVPTHAPDDLRQSDDNILTTEIDRLQNEVHTKLIDVNGSLCMEAGEPVICLRLVKGGLQVFFAFRNDQIVKSSVPIIMLPAHSLVQLGGNDLVASVDVKALIKFHEEQTGRKVNILSEVDIGTLISKTFDYSARNTIVSEAKFRVKDVEISKEWASEQIAAWTRLRDALKAYTKDQLETRVDELSEALQAYAHFENDDIALYTKMLNLLWTRERDLVDTSVDVIDLSDIDIDSLDLSQIPHITLD